MKKSSAGFTCAVPVFLLCIALCIAATGCSRTEKISPVISLAENVLLPAITELIWPDGEDFNYVDCFIAVTADGATRVWDIFSGQLELPEEFFPEKLLSEHRENEKNDPAHGIISPDGRKKITAAEDGSIILSDTDSGRELARYYGFDSGEWLSITSERYYNTSFRGSSYIEVKTNNPHSHRYNLEQLSGALFRPDLFKLFLLSDNNSFESKGKKPANQPVGSLLAELLKDDSMPPQVSISLDRYSLSRGELNITITEQKGGAGLLALYRLSGEEEIPIGLFDIKKAAGKNNGKDNSGFALTVNPGSGLIGISAFNKNNTIESERLWIGIPETAKKDSDDDSSASPVLRVLFAVDGGQATVAESPTVAEPPTPPQIAAFSNFLLDQKKGELFSSVEITKLPDSQFMAENLTRTLDNLRSGAAKNDVIIIYINGQLSADAAGNLQLSYGPSKEQSLSSELLLQSILGFSQDILLLIDNESDISANSTETALRRFRQRLGPRAMLAGSSIIDPVIDGLSRGFGSRFTGAGALLSHATEALKGQQSGFLAFYPYRDFPLSDPLISAGELKFQTMTSGMLRIDQVDAEPHPLTFGNTIIRTLPPGNYIIDMIYRNGYRETRFANLRAKESQWVVFTYTPALLDGSSLGSLPSLGINFAELNPANYERINREAMEGMGMSPHYVAFLAGEKFYRDGKFSEAISEYNRAISLNSGYTEALIARGNARRRLEDYDRAINDYSLALRLNSGEADVYNYRGFAYAQKGDLGRAIADYTQAIRHRADYADAFFNRAIAYGKQNRWDEAIADYTRLLDIEPSNSVAYNERGHAWMGKGDDERAEADYREAEKLK